MEERGNREMSGRDEYGREVERVGGEKGKELKILKKDFDGKTIYKLSVSHHQCL